MRNLQTVSSGCIFPISGIDYIDYISIIYTEAEGCLFSVVISMDDGAELEASFSMPSTTVTLPF